MHYRPMGNSGLCVSEIGLGCNRLGEPIEPDAHWVDLVKHAIELGVNLFDTSESYWWGGSERILGLAIANDPNVFVATKVSRVRETGQKDFSCQRIMMRAEESLKLLKRDCIDIYQLHTPTLEVMQRDDWPEAMSRLKSAGKIRLAGVSIPDAPSGQWLIENDLVDVLQLPYNMILTEIGNTVFPLAQQHGVGIMVRVPMAQGILTGKFNAGKPVPEGHRALLAGDKVNMLVDLAESFKPLAGAEGLSLGQIALRYVLSSAVVSAAIPGARNRVQLEENIAASNGIGLASETLQQIQEIQNRIAGTYTLGPM